MLKGRTLNPPLELWHGKSGKPRKSLVPSRLERHRYQWQPLIGCYNSKDGNFGQKDGILMPMNGIAVARRITNATKILRLGGLRCC